MVESGKTTREVYIGLTEHNTVQVVTFILVVLVSGTAFFLYVVIPLLELFFREFLQANIIKDGTGGTSPLTYWQINIEPEEGPEAHYLFNPLLSFISLTLGVGLAIAFYVSALLPPSIGYVRQKIQREIVNALDKVARVLYDEDVESEHTEVERKLVRMNTRHLHEFADLHNVSFEELETLQRALVWRRMKGWGQILRSPSAIKLYMRTYFTVKYANMMLGVVYIGAAVLIIVIGLRGLKFIPASQPSIIISALQLEFVMLMFYAITVIYTKEDEFQTVQRSVEMEEAAQSASLERLTSALGALSNNPTPEGSGKSGAQQTAYAREVENLLRIFVNNKSKDGDKR